MSFFGVNVNPFSTPVGQKIEQATDGSLPSENWALNMEICDIINETEDGPRDAIKAIRRRLNQAAGKNYTIVMYTLTVLETCVKNCGKCFHALSCSREFVQELVKLIGPKNEPPTAVQEKVLSLIQAWAETFRHQPHTQGVVQVYQELKQKGIEFPMTDLDAMAPIITPQRKVTCQSIPDVEQSRRVAVAPTESDQLVPSAIVQGINIPAQLSEQQLAKLQSELDVVQGNMRVLAEMLTHITNPNPSSSQQVDPADLELLTQLHSTCKAMQERVVDLIGKVAHDEMTAELLRINDELNNLFLRYTRYTKNKATLPSAILAQTMGQPPDIPQASSTLGLAKGDADSLIDLSDRTDMLEQQLANIDMAADRTKDQLKRTEREKYKEGDTHEFDMFAQSRNATYETMKTSGSQYEDNTEQQSSGGSLSSAILNRNNPEHTGHAVSTTVPSTVSNQESEFNEMAAWLDRTPGAPTDQESLTSFEFERFLAERAAAAETLPTLPTTIASTNTSAQRQINKDQDKSLFAL